jgi:hypothetical protein
MKQVVLIISILTYFVLSSTAQPKQVVLDSSNVHVIEISDSSLAVYKSDKEFVYRTDDDKSLSLWERFWLWLWNIIDKTTEKKSVRRGLNIAIWAASISLILYAIYKFSGMEKRYFFRSAEPARIKFSESEDDIRNMDLPQAIAEAEQEGNYRLALRLLYLKSLRQLSDNRLIEYAINKTNHDYERQLAGTPYAESFSRITFLYEFGWYGEFPVDRDMYEKIRSIFLNHEKLLIP